MSVIQKKKRVSKQKKSSWRKYIQHADIDEFLENIRLEERVGKVEDKPSKELYILDASPSKLKPSTTKSERRAQLRNAPIKAFTHLQSTSKVSDPIVKRNRVRTKEERQATLIRVKLQNEQRLKGIKTKKEMQIDEARRRQATHLAMKLANTPEPIFDRDIWDKKQSLLEEFPEIDAAVVENQWITGDTQRHLTRGPGKKTKRIPGTIGKAKSKLKAVQTPHPGMSYNPSFEDHQELLREIAERELKLQKQEEHLKRVTKDIFKRISESQHKERWLEEMSSGLNLNDSDEEEEEDDEEESENESYSINPPVQNKEKTRQQKRKRREQFVLEKEKQKQKEEKKKVADIHKLRFIQQAIEEEQERLKILHERKKRAEAKKETEAARLSTLKYEDPDLEFNMSNDITGNLRNMKMEGNLLLDRFKSMQKRNILQPTKVRTEKRMKVKKVTKSGYKDDWMQGIARPKVVE